MRSKLLLGVSREDITPEIGGHLYGYKDDLYSESIHDNLTVTAFVLKSGNVKAVMISATVCLIQTELADRIRDMVAMDLDIPVEHCILSATHTHSGPNTAANVGWGELDSQYCNDIFIPQILKAVQNAARSMACVRMGIATGNSLVGINRRDLRIDNKVHLGQNEWGPFDPTMTVISFRDESGKVLANMIHYGAHGTSAGVHTEITRDWPGIMTDRLETLSGGITSFFNGPEGDVGPRISSGKTVGNIHYMEELGGIAATDAVRIYKDIKAWRDADLQCHGSVIRIPYDARMSLEDAKKQLEEFTIAKGDNWETRNKYHLEEIIDSYKSGYVEEEYQEIPQSIIRIGEVAFVSFPYEAFSEIGMRIKKGSNIPYVLSLSNANGSEGYFVTQDAICRGGYEVEMHKNARIQPYADDADLHMVKDTINNLEVMTCTE